MIDLLETLMLGLLVVLYMIAVGVAFVFAFVFLAAVAIGVGLMDVVEWLWRGVRKVTWR